jgi:hypothetical protein
MWIWTVNPLLILQSGGLQLPGYPSDLPPAIATTFYVGTALHRGAQLVGRSVDVEKLENLLEDNRRGGLRGVIAVTGIGGIGKTELLLELARLHKGRTSVFFVNAENEEDLFNSYLNMAYSVGPAHILGSRYPPNYDHCRIWRDYSSQQQVEAFKDWFKEPENRQTLFIYDDLNGNSLAISEAMPDQVRNILISTRDYFLAAQAPFRSMHLENMSLREITELMRGSICQHGFTEQQLRSIAEAVHLHPLAALLAISYIFQVLAHDMSLSPVNNFIATMSGSGHERSYHFLKWNCQPRFSHSIMDTFFISRQRLRDEGGSVGDLMDLIAFLETEHMAVDFRNFLLQERPWLAGNYVDLPHYHLLIADKYKRLIWLSELSRVSFVPLADTNGPLQMHQLWLECLRQDLTASKRSRIVKQQLILCHGSVSRDEGSNMELTAHARKALNLAEFFGLEFRTLDIDISVKNWLLTITDR